MLFMCFVFEYVHLHSAQPQSKRRRREPDSDFDFTEALDSFDALGSADGDHSDTSQLSMLSKLVADLKEQVQSVKEAAADLKTLRSQFENVSELRSELNELRQALNESRSNLVAPPQESLHTQTEKRNWSQEAIESGKNLRLYAAKNRDWTINEIEDGEAYLLQCLLCRDWTKETEYDHDSAQLKKKSFAKGIKVTKEQLENASFCYREIRQMIKHETGNRRHFALCKVVKSAMTQCTTNILVKSEVSYLMFSRAEPRELFAKLIQLLHRISNLENCSIDVGNYGHSWGMVDSWRKAYAFYIRTNLIFVFRTPNSCLQLRLYSVSFDHWSRGTEMSIEVMIVHTLIRGKPCIIPLKLSSFQYTQIESVQTTKHKVDQLFKGLEQLQLNSDPSRQDVMLSTVTDGPYLCAQDSDAGQPLLKTEILRRLKHPEFFIDTHYDRAHDREGIKRNAAKKNPAITCFVVILKKGVKNQNTPKWRSMQKSLDSSLSKLIKFSETRFWGHAGRVFERVCTNYAVCMLIQAMIDTQPNKKGTSYRKMWQTQTFVVFALLMRDLSQQCLDDVNFVNQKVLYWFPGEYFFHDMKEFQRLQEFEEHLSKIIKVVTQYKIYQLKRHNPLRDVFKKIRHLMPTFFDAIPELLRGRYLSAQLSSQDMFALYNETAPPDYAYEHDGEFAWDSAEESEDEDNHSSESEYVPDEPVILSSRDVEEHQRRASERIQYEISFLSHKHQYNYIKCCSGNSRCVSKMWRCSSDSCQRWACLLHLAKVHKYPFLPNTVQLAQQEIIPNANENPVEHQALCSSDSIFGAMEQQEWLCCDCLDSIIGAVENIKKYTEYIRVQQYENMKWNEHPGVMWYEICVPKMVLCMRSRQVIDQNLSDDQFMAKGADRFVKHYNWWRSKLNDSETFGELLNHSDIVIKEHFIAFKRWLMLQIRENLPSLNKVTNVGGVPPTQSQRAKQLKRNKKQFLKRIYFAIQEVLRTDFPSLRLLWDIALNDLRSETIVESVCSIVKQIYSENRRKLDLKTLTETVLLRLSLPNDHKDRDKIVKFCGQIFEIIHGNQIVKESYKAKRDQSVSISPSIDKDSSRDKDSIYSCPVMVDEVQIMNELKNRIHEGKM